jgi:hypothetical protein
MDRVGAGILAAIEEIRQMTGDGLEGVRRRGKRWWMVRMGE